jgi:hypothetical protein
MFSPTVLITPMLHTHLSSEPGTVGSAVVGVPHPTLRIKKTIIFFLFGL